MNHLTAALVTCAGELLLAARWLALAGRLCSTESEPGRYELKGSAFTSPFLRCAPLVPG